MLRGLFLALPLGGCLLSVDKPEPRLDIPQVYSAGPKNPKAAEAALPSLDWWRTFHSRELTEITGEALEANLDIAAAVARIVQADANARIGGAALLPAANFRSIATHSRASQSFGVGGASESNDFLLGLTASYEIDFWGKNRAALFALEDTAVASRFDRDVVALSTVVVGANFYFQVLATQDLLRVARNNVVSAQRVLDVVKQRAETGTASPLEVAQQESVVATQRAAIPPLERALAQFRNALAVLMGRPPELVRIRGGSLNSIAVPRVTPGLPSELLTQRPDIREAEANLAAANANVYNARAQLLPSITLTGAAGYESPVLGTLLRPESAFYALAAGLTQPIFQGGRLLGNIDLQTGRQDELLQIYRKAVISGFSDVETALTGIRTTADEERLQREVVASSRRAFDISETRLREGTIDLLTVLQTQQTLFAAENALVQARLARFLAVVSLYQALGGGWSPTPVEPVNAG
jgi:NodT family efflux transporter outer membrane factor (OMF) lipoprotein